MFQGLQEFIQKCRTSKEKTKDFFEKLDRINKEKENNKDKIMVNFQEEVIPADKLNEVKVKKESPVDERIRKTDFVKKIFFDAMDAAAHPNKTEEIKSLWVELIKAYQFRAFFNFNYLYDILTHYLNYCKYIEMDGDGKPHSTVIFAIVLQRIGGTKNNFTQNAELAAKTLYEQIGLSKHLCEWVRDLILSTNSLELKGEDIRFMHLRDCQFARLGVDYPEFLENQSNVYEERFRFPLTRMEFYRCQFAVFHQILKMPAIFVNWYFKNKFEVKSRENIHKYLQLLDHKIKELERIEIEEKIASSGGGCYKD